MAEYIEREAAIAWFMPYAHTGESIDADVVISDIKGMKTADVAPVRHGQWEKQSGLYSCSECGRICPYDAQADVIEYWVCNYCPNCGAKMDAQNIMMKRTKT